MKSRRNWIVVFGGPKPGVYDGWDEARPYCDGYPVYKEGYDSEMEAKNIYAAGVVAYLHAKKVEEKLKKEKDKPSKALW
jgi:viroplasmin and RNaseH domain-containing protein